MKITISKVIEKLTSLSNPKGSELAQEIEDARDYTTLQVCLECAKELSSDALRDIRVETLRKETPIPGSGLNLPQSGRVQDQQRTRADAAWAIAYAEQETFKQAIKVIVALQEELNPEPDWAWIEKYLKGTDASIEGELQRFAFVTRHQPTEEQTALATEMGIELIPVGDTNAFAVDPEFLEAKGIFDGVVIVHPAAALRLANRFMVGVFENANRAPEGERPQFSAKALHIYDLRR